MIWQPAFFGGFFRPDHDPPVGGISEFAYFAVKQK
jgi:hypothetical protein